MDFYFAFTQESLTRIKINVEIYDFYVPKKYTSIHFL